MFGLPRIRLCLIVLAFVSLDAAGARAQGDLESGALEALEIARQHIAAGDFAAARAPAQQAIELLPSGGNTRALIAEAEAAIALATNDPSAALPDELRPLIVALTNAEAAGVAPAPVLIAGWTNVLGALTANQRWRDAEIAADRAIGLLGTVDSPPLDLRIAAASDGARAAVNTGAYDVAAWRYAWGAAGISPLREADGRIDPAWIDLAVRSAAARAAWLTLDDDHEEPTIPAIVMPQQAVSPICAPVWFASPEARIPRHVARRSPGGAGPGAALVSFFIAPDGAVQDLALLAVAPAERLSFQDNASEAALDAARRWRADPATLAGCNDVPYVATFLFTLD